MKLWHLIVLGAVGYGAWWWWRRGGGNPLALFDRQTGASSPVYYAPPAVPLPPPQPGTVGGGWADTAGDFAGAGATGYCVSQGGDPRGCQLAGGAVDWVVDKAAPKAWEGIKKVGSGAKSVAKKLIPGW